VQPELLFKLTVCPFEVGERIQNNRSRSLCLFTSNQLLTRYHCHILLLPVPSLQNPYSIFQAPSLNSSLSRCVTDIPATTNALTLRSSGTIAPQQRLIWKQATKRLAAMQLLRQPSQVLCLAPSKIASSQTKAGAGYAVNATRGPIPGAGVPLP
jgi:hypothetical protein